MPRPLLPRPLPRLASLRPPHLSRGLLLGKCNLGAEILQMLTASAVAAGSSAAVSAAASATPSSGAASNAFVGVPALAAGLLGGLALLV